MPFLLRRGIALLGLILSSLPATHAQTASYESFELKPRGQAPVPAQLGTLKVPARHGQPGQASLELRFVRLAAVKPAPGRAPVVYLAGGPGGSGIASALGARWPLFDRIRQEQDLILLDQRGTGRSSAPPPCPHALRLANDQVHGHAEQLAAVQAQARACMDFWRERAWDANAFNTQESAADLSLLRHALGVPRISLWSMSYGTHLAFEALRSHADAIERVILMGSEGPNDTLKLPLDADRLIAQIAALTQRPELPTLIAQTIERLHKQPRTLPVVGMEGGMRVGSFDLQLATVMLLARRDSALQLPAFFDALAADHWEPLGQIMQPLRRHLAELRLMPLAMDVASGATAQRLRQIEAEEARSLLGPALNFPFPQIGQGLGIQDLGDAFRRSPQTTVPALFVSGELDGRTPLHNAERLQHGFRQSSHLIVEGAGHDDDLWLASPLLAERLADFLAAKPVPNELLARR